MAPPRQRPPPSSFPGGGDDSRSEASSTATGGPTSRGIPGPKPRKTAAAVAISGVAATTTGTLASAKDLKVAAATGAAAAANAAAAATMSGLAQGNGVDFYGVDGFRDDLPGVCSYRYPVVIVVMNKANGFSLFWVDRYRGIKCPSQSCTITDTPTNSPHQAPTPDPSRRYTSPLASVFALRQLSQLEKPLRRSLHPRPRHLHHLHQHHPDQRTAPGMPFSSHRRRRAEHAR